MKTGRKKKTHAGEINLKKAQYDGAMRFYSKNKKEILKKAEEQLKHSSIIEINSKEEMEKIIKEKNLKKNARTFQMLKETEPEIQDIDKEKLMNTWLMWIFQTMVGMKLKEIDPPQLAQYEDETKYIITSQYILDDPRMKFRSVIYQFETV